MNLCLGCKCMNFELKKSLAEALHSLDLVELMGVVSSAPLSSFLAQMPTPEFSSVIHASMVFWPLAINLFLSDKVYC